MDQKLTDGTQFTNKNIAFATPGRHQITGTKGLYLWVSPGGDVRRWLYRHTSPATRRVTETGLGMWPEVALSDATAKVDGMRKQVASGICPTHAKRAERANQVTFKQAAEQWLTIHKNSWKGGDQGSSVRNITLLLFTHGEPLAKMPVRSITPDMVQAALDKLWARAPVQARRALGVWESVLEFAKAKGWRQGDNPCAWKGCHQYRWPKRRAADRGHHAALAYEDLPTFMQQLRQKQERSTGALMLEFLILTCARSGEVFGATWDEIDFDKKQWVIPGARMKAGKEHVVPLSDRALEILNSQKQYANGSGYVFSGYKRKRMASQAMIWVLKHMGVKATVHGFRSSFRDWCGNETHFPREPVEECLAHTVGNATERAYRRQTALNKRREIMDAWASFCEGP
jgi:integrase